MKCSRILDQQGHIIHVESVHGGGSQKCLGTEVVRDGHSIWLYYHRVYVPEGQSLKSDLKEPLRVYVSFQHIQKMLPNETVVLAETEDSWFNCQKLK